MTLLRSLLLGLCVIVLGCSSNGSDGEYDEGEIIEMRQEKDAQFRDGDDSPLPADKRTSFTGLSYFAPDPEYVVMAKFVESTSQDTIALQTSKEDVRKAFRAGAFTFRLNGKDLKLWAYTFADSEDTESLFVPFTDKTSGHETYYGGRYMDVPMVDGDDYVLDFNMAYNPYCAYNDKYSCPLVPNENDLSTAVRAGEKK
ncbi:MAG: DUF1684 domain-containing protein [Ignavibacteria bacterium]|jgi:uncharacterized protein (DUF1684 family)